MVVPKTFARLSSDGAAVPADAIAPLLEADAILGVALRAGQLMLEHGANTARVEETTQRLGRALGATALDVFVTPGGLLVSLAADGVVRTRFQRVVDSGVDLDRVAAVLQVSREAARGALDQAGVRAALEQIATQPRQYSRSLTTLAVAVGCACFALLFGGGFWACLVVACAAALAQSLRAFLTRIHFSRLLTTGLVAGAATALALLGDTTVEMLVLPVVRGVPWLPQAAPSHAVTVASAVLLLVPGVLMVSSIADLFRGDTLGGIVRAGVALLHIAAIGGGVWSVVLLSGMTVEVGSGQAPALLLALPAAGLGAAAFGVLFNVPRRALFLAGCVGALGYATRQLALAWGVPPEAAAFASGLVIGTCAELLARQLRLPTAIFSIPGFIPLVPGVLAFRTVLDFVGADYATGTANLIQAALLTAALAAGLGVINALVRQTRVTR